MLLYASVEQFDWDLMYVRRDCSSSVFYYSTVAQAALLALDACNDVMCDKDSLDPEYDVIHES